MIQPTQHTPDKQQYLQECQLSYSKEDTTLNIYVDSSSINLVSIQSLSKTMLSWHGPNSQQQTGMPQFYYYNRCPASYDIDLPKNSKTISYLAYIIFFFSLFCFGTKCKTFYLKWLRLPNKVLNKYIT